MKRFLAVLLVSLMLISALVGCTPSTPEPQPSGDKIMRLGGDYGTDGHIDAIHLSTSGHPLQLYL